MEQQGQHFPTDQLANEVHDHVIPSEDVGFVVLQQPKMGKVAVGEEKNRKPIDPPPVVQLTISQKWDVRRTYLHSPYLFSTCVLVQSEKGNAPQPSGASLVGTIVSSLHRLKDSKNKDGAFFIFGDIASKVEGVFMLQFNLYEMREGQCIHIQSALSNPFPVHGQKNFPGLLASTPLTRSFAEQGVRLRVRKEPRTLLKKRGPSDDIYVPRQYNRKPRQEKPLDEELEDVEVSPTSSRHSQIEQEGSLQSRRAPSHRHDPRQQMAIGYSQQSPVQYRSYPVDSIAKRPRSDPEQEEFGQNSQATMFNQQSQQMAYGQERPFAVVTSIPSPGDNGLRNISDHQQSPYDSYSQHSPTQDAYGYQFDRSPPAVRGNYFPAQQGPMSQSNQHTASAHFAPQPQAQYAQAQAYGGQVTPSSVLHDIQNPFDNMGMVNAPRSPGMGEGDIGPPRFARPTISPGYGSMMMNQAGQGDHRDIFGIPGFPGANFSAGNVPLRLGLSRSPRAPMTSGPGSTENSY